MAGETATASGTACRETGELLWVTGICFTVYINYFFGVNSMSLLTSKENTLAFALLCLTSLAARILELGDAWDRRDREQSRSFDNQPFSCKKIIKRLWDIRCIWSKNISHPAYLLVPSIQPHATNFVFFQVPIKWAVQFSALQAFHFTSPELFPSGRYCKFYLIMVVTNCGS